MELKSEISKPKGPDNSGSLRGAGNHEVELYSFEDANKWEPKPVVQEKLEEAKRFIESHFVGDSAKKMGLLYGITGFLGLGVLYGITSGIEYGVTRGLETFSIKLPNFSPKLRETFDSAPVVYGILLLVVGAYAGHKGSQFYQERNQEFTDPPPSPPPGQSH